MKVSPPSLLILVLGMVLSSCVRDEQPAPLDQPSEPSPVDSPTLLANAMTCADATAVNLDEEPHYSADYLHRWETHDGCEVRLDYVMTRTGACFDGVDEVLTGWPLGTTSRRPHEYRIFFRDPGGVTGVKTAADFDPDASLPAGAMDTGLRWDGNGLWIAPDDDTFVWLVGADHVERWPQENPGFGCD